MTTIEEHSKLLARLLHQAQSLHDDVTDLQQQLANVRTHLHQIIQDAANGWLNPRPAASVLMSAGIRNAQHLKELLYAGIFINGVHVRNLGSEVQPSWQFNIPCCREAIEYYHSLTPEERETQLVRDLCWGSITMKSRSVR